MPRIKNSHSRGADMLAVTTAPVFTGTIHSQDPQTLKAQKLAGTNAPVCDGTVHRQDPHTLKAYMLAVTTAPVFTLQ